ncbi:MAP7 domain-containing protein 2a isoform X2 [Phyllopteryx taeniolatus]|uniref:MAP7 domain-containing protein 2a isoform X2 n=1 Tax=Phyllopteryx taeniolatus TaxID=161469 RepID=UPI002AD550E1|nr:MAP7 domain-containing protein 2a isoform X2 [Phyllopteryx taeniolatus]
MANITPSDTVAAVVKMAPPTVPHADKGSGTNSHNSPARTKKTTNTDKKLLLNGHASPSHLVANISTNHVGKPIVEGVLKTDDRMRLAKERREEREKTLAAREQLIKEKERRSQLQYERTVEERWKRLEEQRHKEELRRAAVEEKRRLQLEEEKERLEALMRRSLVRSLNLENRQKRWSRGFTIGAGDTENASFSVSAASTLSHGLASPLPAVSESAPCSPRRSPLCSSRSPADPLRSGLLEGSQSTPNTPKKKHLQNERRTASPGGALTNTNRRSESPANITKQLTSSTTSKLASKTRMQSPNNIHEYHHSPTRPRLSNDKKAHTKGDAVGNNNRHIHNTADVYQAKSSEVIKGDVSENKEDSFRRKTEHITQNGEKNRESSPCTSTGKVAAGITNAEDASRLLAERRRQARAQKELEDKKREEEKRLKEDQLTRQHAQEQCQQEGKESGKKGTDSNTAMQKEHKRQQDAQEKELMGREREKANVQTNEEMQRQRQDREQQTQHLDEERQLRKKRIDEIMKRTRKGETDVKDEQVETRSPPGEVKNGETKAQEDFKWCREQVSSQGDRGRKKKAAQMDCQKHVENNTQQVIPAHSVPDNRLDTRKMIDTDKITKDGVDDPQLHDREMQVNANKPRINFKDMDPFKEEPTNEINGVVRRAESFPMRDHVTAEVSKQKAASLSGGNEERVTPLPLRPRPPRAIHLEPLEVKRSCDEVQSMDVSPASKEELISIPEFSPVNEIQQSGISNTRALQDLMDLTGSVTCSNRTAEDNVGDCNKNLIQGVVSPISDSKLIGISSPSSNQLNIH